MSLSKPVGKRVVKCNYCDQLVNGDLELKNHLLKEHGDVSKPGRDRGVAVCEVCQKEIKGGHHLKRHKERMHPKLIEINYDCPFGDFHGATDLNYLKSHYKRKHTASNYKCGKCGQQFTEFGFWETAKDAHVDQCMKFILPEDYPTLEPPPGIHLPEFEEEPMTKPTRDHPIFDEPLIKSPPEEVVQEVQHYWDDIRTNFRLQSRLVKKYIFRTAGSDVVNFSMSRALQYIYLHNTNPFTFNVAMTYLLMKDEDDIISFRVFTAQKDMEDIFERNLFVHDLASLKVAMKKVEVAEEEFPEKVDRPSTKWRFICTLSVCFFVYIRPNFVAGRGKSRLPDYLTKNPTMQTMELDKNGNLFQDKLCFFRCVVAELGGDFYDQDSVIDAYEKFRRAVGGRFCWKDFPGMTEEDIPKAEEVFDLNVQILMYDSNQKAHVTRKATNPNRPTLNVVLHYFAPK